MAKFDGLYMRFAIDNSLQSHDTRYKVGSVFVRDDRILAHGWNGTVPGECNHLQDESVIHSELNAILRAARDGESLNGSTLYCTHSPCRRCSRMLSVVGISRLVYLDEYQDKEPIEWLQGKGVSVEKILCRDR